MNQNKILLINSDGKNLGETDYQQARKTAEEQSLDLIRVGGSDGRSVYKIMDRGKSQYSKKKNTKQNKKSHKTHTKEMRFTASIDPHDLQTKMNKLEKFIDKKYIVRVQVILKGREKSRPEIGLEKMKEILEPIRDKVRIDLVKPITDSESSRQLKITTTLHPI